MSVEVVDTDKAPAAVGAYSQATVHNGVIYTSGQIAIDSTTGELVTESFEQEALQVLTQIIELVEASGGTVASILKTNVYLTDIDHYSTLNDVYERRLDSPYPARSVVEIQTLPKQARLEIDAKARRTT